MDRFKKTAKTLLCPHWSIVILLCLASAAGLCWVFLLENETSYLSYGIYVLSFYALTVFCIRLVPFLQKRAMARKQSKSNISREQQEKRFRISLLRRLVVNLIYALFNFIASLIYKSTWLGSIGLYYLVLAVIHLILVLYQQRLRHISDPLKQWRKGWSGFQLTGILLFVLHLTMTGMVFQIIWQGQGKEYPGIFVFAAAAYTFYRLIGGIVQVVQCRKHASPVLGAAKNISLTEALISLFFLQTAMFSAFGGDFGYQQLMNALTGGAVCLLAVLGSLGMVIHGHQRKKKFGENGNG